MILQQLLNLTKRQKENCDIWLPKLENLDNGNKTKYQILGEFESNPSEGTISYKSPLGRELIGCKKGDVIAIMRPAGDIEYEILDIFVP